MSRKTEPLTNELLREYRGAMPHYVFKDATMGNIDARRKAAAAINAARTSCVVMVDAEAKPERPDPPWLDELLDALGWQCGNASTAIEAVRQSRLDRVLSGSATDRRRKGRSG